MAWRTETINGKAHVVSDGILAALGTYVLTLNGRPAANYISGRKSREDVEKDAERYRTYEWVGDRTVAVEKVTLDNADDLLASCVLVDMCH
jgi:hypothetical protein